MTKDSKKQFKKLSTEFGVKDTLNSYFIDQALNLHEDKTKTDVEIGELCQIYKDEYQDHIFNPFLRLKGM